MHYGAEMPSIRLCRLLIFSITFGLPSFIPDPDEEVVAPHTVLVVIQMEEGEPIVSIIDSKAYYFGPELRERMFKIAVGVMRDFRWWRYSFDKYEDVPEPESAYRLPCAQQPSDHECGYLTILNGWALALGLELNVHAAPLWDYKPAGVDANFYSAVLEMCHYARLGVAEWRLIYAFLRCHRLVHEGEVPRARRFTRTLASHR
jgi:hypothetical protein